MPVRRTRKQKQRARQRHQASMQMGSMAPSSVSFSPPTAAKSIQTPTKDLLSVPSHYIGSDLIKTLSLSVVLIAIILGLYWYTSVYDQLLPRL